MSWAVLLSQSSLEFTVPFSSVWVIRVCLNTFHNWHPHPTCEAQLPKLHQLIYSTSLISWDTIPCPLPLAMVPALPSPGLVRGAGCSLGSFLPSLMLPERGTAKGWAGGICVIRGDGWGSCWMMVAGWAGIWNRKENGEVRAGFGQLPHLWEQLSSAQASGKFWGSRGEAAEAVGCMSRQGCALESGWMARLECGQPCHSFCHPVPRVSHSHCSFWALFARWFALRFCCRQQGSHKKARSASSLFVGWAIPYSSQMLSAQTGTVLVLLSRRQSLQSAG